MRGVCVCSRRSGEARSAGHTDQLSAVAALAAGAAGGSAPAIAAVSAETDQECGTSAFAAGPTGIRGGSSRPAGAAVANQHACVTAGTAGRPESADPTGATRTGQRAAGSASTAGPTSGDA